MERDEVLEIIDLLDEQFEKKIKCLRAVEQKQLNLLEKNDKFYYCSLAGVYSSLFSLAVERGREVFWEAKAACFKNSWKNKRLKS